MAPKNGGVYGSIDCFYLNLCILLSADNHWIYPQKEERRRHTHCEFFPRMDIDWLGRCFCVVTYRRMNETSMDQLNL